MCLVHGMRTDSSMDDTRKSPASLFITLCLLLGLAAQANAVDGHGGSLEIGYEHTEHEQNRYRDPGSSNYTFFIGQQSSDSIFFSKDTYFCHISKG